MNRFLTLSGCFRLDKYSSTLYLHACCKQQYFVDNQAQYSPQETDIANKTTILSGTLVSQPLPLVFQTFHHSKTKQRNILATNANSQGVGLLVFTKGLFDFIASRQIFVRTEQRVKTSLFYLTSTPLPGV